MTIIRNIILLLLMICGIGGCYMSRTKIYDLEADYKVKLDALPELYTPQQIQEALNAPESKLYVICGYKFPKFEPYIDNYIYYYHKIYDAKEGKHNGSPYEMEPSDSQEHFGKLYIDENIEFTSIKSAYFGGCTSTSEADYFKKTEKGYLQGDEPLWATALLGNHTAKCEGIDGADGSIAGKSKYYLHSNTGHKLYFIIEVISIIVACVAGYFLLRGKNKRY